MKHFLCLLIFSFVAGLAHGASPDCDGKAGTDLKFPAGKRYRLLSYNASTMTYKVGSFDFPGEDPLDISPAVLADSTKALHGQKKELANHSEEYLDQVYQADAAMTSFTLKELAGRKACLQK